MMRFSKFVVLLLLTQLTCQAGVIYREIFATGPNAKASGWHYFVTGKAWDASSDNCWADAPGAGSKPAVNSFPSGNDYSWKGSVFLPSGDCYLFFTDEFEVTDPVVSFSWYMNLGNPSDMVYVAVKIGGKWFVSDQGLNKNGVSPESAGGTNINFMFKDSKWRVLTFEPPMSPAGGILSLDLKSPSMDLPPGSISAFGLYCPKRTSTHSFDTFTIDSTVAKP